MTALQPERESLLDWLRAEPPRAIPRSIRKRRLKAGPLLMTVAVAFVAVLLSVPLYERIVPKRLFDDLALNHGDPQIVYGDLVETTTLDLRRKTEGGESEPVQRFRFRFTAPSGETIEGTSHAIANPYGLQTELPIEVDPKDPRVSRIRGTRCSAEPLSGVFVLLFPFVPLVWVFGVWRKRRRIRDLLRDGLLVEARVASTTEVRPTGAAGTTRPEVTFDYAVGEASTRERRRADHRPTPQEMEWIAACDERGQPMMLLVEDSKSTRPELLVLEPDPTTMQDQGDEDPYADELYADDQGD